MRHFLAQCFLLICVCAIHLHAQVPTAPAKLEIEILSFKIGSNYNPLLDRQPSVFSAESVELPQTEAEKVARRNAQSNNRNTTGVYNQNSPRGVIAPEDKSTRGRLRSSIRIIDLAEWVNVEVKNTSDKTIKLVEWDFLFPRMENDVLKLRYAVTSKAEVKSGTKKKLKVILPPTAMKCKVMNVKGDQAQESVCGKGFTDASKFEQENVVINRIEYADGTVWKREP
jgi:hypothetical protein